MWTGAKHPNLSQRLGRECIADRFCKGWEIVWGVVIDEENFVPVVGQELGDAIEADRDTTVQIVAVVVIAAINNNGNHSSFSGGSALPRPGLTIRFAGAIIRGVSRPVRCVSGARLRGRAHARRLLPEEIGHFGCVACDECIASSCWSPENLVQRRYDRRRR